MEDYKERLEEQLKEIDALISRTDRALLNYRNLPDHRIIVSKSNGCDQYYYVDRKTRERRYIKAGEVEMIRKTVQRDYETEVNKKLKKNKRLLESFLAQYDFSEIGGIYSKMADSRKKLVVPVVEPEESYVEKWKSVLYDPMPIDNDTVFYSEKGVRVRSKSEVLIANMLEQRGIPYRYEFPLRLKKAGYVRPDFMCLNVKTRKELFWEHFGMMDNESYVNNCMTKIANYETEGFFPGKDLIFTFETSQHPVSSVVIKNTIEEYLC